MDKYQKLKNEHKELWYQVSRVLNQFDPIGLIHIGCPNDEYDPEVSTILPQLKQCKSEKDTWNMIYNEFVKWFDNSITGAKEKYKPIAKEIWEIKKRHII